MSLKENIDYILEVLRNHLSEEGMETGWNQAIRKKWIDWYEELDRKLANGDDLPSPMLAMRAMDFDGVGNTAISHIAARIDNRINKGERY
jgi:hypothetical protein